MTIKFSITDMTSILPKKPGELPFNPTVAFWKDNLYLCTYRVFIRYDNLDTTKYEEDPNKNPNHPWLGGKQSTMYWNSEQGYDRSRLVLLSIDSNENITVKKYYGDIPGVDGRLLKIDDNIFVYTYNNFVYDKTVKLKSRDCENGCFLLEVRLLNIKDKNTIDISANTILCPEISQKIEKNWSVWRTGANTMKFSYGLIPVHEVFDLTFKNDNLHCTNIENIQKGANSFFYDLEKYYGNPRGEKFCGSNEGDVLCVSLSTPAIKHSNGKFIGVGHVKYAYGRVKDNVPIDSPLYRFNELIKDKIFHPDYVYMMFFYEFEDNFPYDITRVSPSFLTESNYTLDFSSGFTYSPDLNKYILSFGDADMESKCLFITPSEVENHLLPPPPVNEYEFLLI